MSLSHTNKFCEINSLIAAANTVELRDAVFDRIEALLRGYPPVTLEAIAGGLSIPLEILKRRGTEVIRLRIGTLLRGRFPPLVETIEGVPFFVSDEVIVPPDEQEVRIVAGGDESLKPPRIFPRTRLIFDVLRSLGINPLDTFQCACRSGTNTSNMMRRENYRAIAIGPLSKIILVCDEEGNRTFVIHRNDPVERYTRLRKSQLKSMIPSGEVSDLIWKGDEAEWKSSLAEHLARPSGEADTALSNPITPPAPGPTRKMDADYFRNREIIEADLQAFADALAEGRRITDLNTGNIQCLSVVCANGETCRGPNYLYRAGVAFGTAKWQHATVLKMLKRLAGIEVFPSMDAAYFTPANVQHDLQAYADALGEGKVIADLNTGNLQCLSVVCANGETCSGVTYIRRAGVALGIGTRAKIRRAAIITKLKKIAGFEVEEYLPMDAAYFTPANVQHDLQAYADAFGEGKAITDLSTYSMENSVIRAANGECCGGITYMLRAGVALGMAISARKAHSQMAVILAELKEILGQAT